MTPSKYDDDGAAGQAFLPVAHRSTSSPSPSNASVANTICSSVTLLPFQALQRMMQCFGYTHSVRMQSGRTYVGDRCIAHRRAWWCCSWGLY